MYNPAMKLSVLQWNVWYQEDIRNIAACLQDLRPDVICLQELSNGYQRQAVQDGPDFIARELGYQAFVKDIPLDQPDGTVFHLANGIFSRYEIKQSSSTWINQPSGNGGYDDERRAYLQVQLRLDGDPVTVATTHMSYTHGFTETNRKRAETDVLTAELAKQKSRFIFTGDLNATESSYTIRQVSRLLKDVGAKANTWTTKPFSYNGFEENDLKWRLDYVFATPDLPVVTSEVMPTEYSDHLPVLTVFDV